jgi:PAS domain S-box-containing protein
MTDRPTPRSSNGRPSGEADAASSPRATYDTVAAQVAQKPGGIAHESGELHRLLVESVQDYAIFALDPQGYILSWNAGAERFKGYTADEIIGKHFSIFYPPEKIRERFPEYELRIAARDGRFEDEGWRVRKDGTRFWANVVITALRGEDGGVIGFAKVTRDLTARRAAEERAIEDARRVAAAEAARTAAEDRARELADLAEELEEQAVELEAANRAKAEFLAAISHDLRTPLNAIGGYAELMALGITGPVTPEQAEQLERIRRSQQHLLGIINDMLNFSRIEAGQLTYEVDAVPLHEVVASMTKMVTLQARTKGLKLEQLPCPPDVVARADRAKVEQILLNLLSNAVKFTDAGGTITLSCERHGEQVAVAVRDTGEGVPADKLEAIFDPFVQLGRSLTSTREGTGLGLAISRDLARAMGGDITVDSTVDVGSTFTVLLPAYG